MYGEGKLRYTELSVPMTAYKTSYLLESRQLCRDVGAKIYSKWLAIEFGSRGLGLGLG